MEFKVSLNGNNYISDKRKNAFEKALEDGHQIKLKGNGQKPNVVERRPGDVIESQLSTISHTPSSVSSQPQRDYSRMFETLELGLKQSYGHQSETLRVHQQYLSNQADYASIFSQLMQQQGTLFSNGNTSPEKSEITLTVLKSLERSIEQFHRHQTETLTVHNQFLHQQSAYAQAFVELLRQQNDGSHNGNDGLRPTPLTESTYIDKPIHSVPEPVASVKSSVEPFPPQSVIPVDVAPPAESQLLSTDQVVIDRSALQQMLLTIVSDKTGYPVEMLELDMDMEADLGIYSIKRVEILGSLQDQAPDLPEIDPDALAELRTLSQIIAYMDAANEGSDASDKELQNKVLVVDDRNIEPVTASEVTIPDSSVLNTALLNIVSDKTGYPAEMLELDMDMEADLGIDSIKRVEILGALQDQYPELPDFDADALSDLRTLQQIIEYIDGQETAEKKV